MQELNELAASERKAQTPMRIRCCMAAGCLSANSQAVFDRLRHAVDSQGLEDKVRVCKVGCLRLCCEGPLVQVDPEGVLYQKVTPESAPSIVGSLTGGHATAMHGDPANPFFQLQSSVVLANCGQIEPERIESYIAAGGYRSLAQAIHEMTPAEVIGEITRSGLRGRGGAGYPTGLKWATVAKQSALRRFVVCNADEGDPGAFMNRSVLESDPHSVLEGMAIAAYAIGASRAYIYCRGEYPLAIERLKIGIKQAEKLGLLGSRICGSSFDFTIEIRIGAGAFVCGEETALMASIMGGRGTPSPRPPYPAERGLWGCPTLINNVETFANVPASSAAAQTGSPASAPKRARARRSSASQAKCETSAWWKSHWALPCGTSSKTLAAARRTAASKPCKPAAPRAAAFRPNISTRRSTTNRSALGSIMGSGGMIVMDDKNDMVDVARYFMEFCMDESCGKCIPCRAGTVQLHRLLTKIVSGSATQADLALLESLCEMVQSTSLCGLGQTAPNPVLSTLRYFRDEYVSRLRPPADVAAAAGHQTLSASK